MNWKSVSWKFVCRYGWMHGWMNGNMDVCELKNYRCFAVSLFRYLEVCALKVYGLEVCDMKF